LAGRERADGNRIHVEVPQSRSNRCPVAGHIPRNLLAVERHGDRRLDDSPKEWRERSHHPITKVDNIDVSPRTACAQGGPDHEFGVFPLLSGEREYPAPPRIRVHELHRELLHAPNGGRILPRDEQH
jgi:hypothetical protein